VSGVKKPIKPIIDNPFKMPADTDIFMLREKEKQHKLEVTKTLWIFNFFSCFLSLNLN